MALIGNNTVLNRNANRHFSGGAASGYYGGMTPYNAQKNRFSTLAISDKAGNPNGYLANISWVLPLKSGGMSVHSPDEFRIAVSTANAKMGRNLVASSTMVITNIDATADKIISGTASDTLVLALVTASMTAGIYGTASKALAISVSSAVLGGTIPASGSSSCTMTPNSTMTAKAFMEAIAGGPTPLSPEGLASAVWESSAAEFNTAGSMGEKLNDAGSAGNPWAANLSDNNTEGTFGWFMQKVLTVAKFLGLK